MTDFTLAVPFYRNCQMLDRQVIEWEQYPKGVEIIVVDDGSPEPALPIVEARASASLLKRVRVFRITVDVPWNREGARNLAATVCDTEWILNVDIDHILPFTSAKALRSFNAIAGRWYRFSRFRVGKADETRRKDDLPDDCEFGQIKPHIDSHLMTRETYWKAGGYDEDFAGTLGGGSDFLRRVERVVGPPHLATADACLHVYTRDRITDASDFSLSRDTSKGKQIQRQKDLMRARLGGPVTHFAPTNPLRFPWVRER